VSEEAQAVLEAARKLSPEEQVLIAETLFHEHGYEYVEMSEEEWAAELERRVDESDQGRGGSIRWEVLRDEK
jgi:putative addiction module component (TIGR02574 family)